MAKVRVWLSKDHPRLRGEKLLSIPMAISFMGSPPLTRGKDSQVPFLLHLCRITPAYAGKSSRDRALKRAHEDHPRLRGEKHFFFIFALPPVGSPPLTRGKVQRLLLLRLQARITPAYAGKSSTR